jgi:hypothetical protein
LPELPRPCAICALVLIAALAGCKSKQQEHDEFVAVCIAHKFEPQQCEFLAQMSEKSSDDAEAAAAIGISGMAVGVGVSAFSKGK